VPGSDRKNLFAIGIAVLLALLAGAAIFDSANAQENFYADRAEQRALAYRDTARMHAARECAAVSRSQIYQCVHDQYHAAGERERSEYDLQAQLVMSVWTRAMGLAALIAMAVGILGVGLVYATFSATREANVIARQEADRSALETDRVRRNMIQIERAILEIERTNISFDPDGKWMTLTLSVRNRGKSNAWGLQVFTGERKSRVFRNKFTGHRVMSLIVNADVRAVTGAVRVRVPKDVPVWVFGYLQYTTAHEATFKSFFCCRLDGIPTENEYGESLNAPRDARAEVDLPPDT
jgi:hypothetical protein